MMKPATLEKLKRSLVAHEGEKHFPYIDTVGKITIGIGYNLTERGLDQIWINTQYQNDVQYFYNQLSEFSWFNTLNSDRQIVLIDMAFMGWKRFLEFNNLISALSEGDFKEASEAMLNSKWAEEVKGRSATLAEAMLTGIYNL